MNKPKVSVVAISYNQEKYIREALDSFVTQQTDFDFEIVIADDCSTDQTASIIQEYADAHPHLFKPILRKKNVGVQENLYDAMRTASGQYLALCEGDDYWTDTKKLQKQADFLDGHPDYALCFHPVQVFFEDDASKNYIHPAPEDGQDFTLKRLFKENYIQTNSVMYRKQDYTKMPLAILPLDWYLHVYHAQFGKIGFVNGTMAAYRRHPGGVWWGSQNDADQLWRRHGLAHILVFAEMLKLYGDNTEYKQIIMQHVCFVLERLMEVDKKYNEQFLKQALKKFPGDTEAIVLAMHQTNQEVLRTTKAHMDEQAKIIEHLGNERDDKERQLEHAMQELARVNKELDSIRKSLTWRVKQKISNRRQRTR